MSERHEESKQGEVARVTVQADQVIRDFVLKRERSDHETGAAQRQRQRQPLADAQENGGGGRRNGPEGQ